VKTGLCRMGYKCRMTEVSKTARRQAAAGAWLGDELRDASFRAAFKRAWRDERPIVVVTKGVSVRAGVGARRGRRRRRAQERRMVG